MPSLAVIDAVKPEPWDRPAPLGKIQQLHNCCREVRLGASNLAPGMVLAGWNMITDEPEAWEVFQVSKKDPYKSLVKRIR